MVNQIISDTRETLGQQAGQVVQQVVQEPAKIAEAMAGQVGIKPVAGGKQTQPQNPTPAELAQKEALRRGRLQSLQREAQVLQSRQARELPKYVTGKPGFSAGEEGKKAVKQLKSLEPKKEGAKEELPPPLAAAKRKGPERLKGANG